MPEYVPLVHGAILAVFAGVLGAENNGDHFHQDLGPMPQAGKPDF